MNLGTLEFTADDFKGALPILNPIGRERIADFVNALLLDRLRTAPEVFSDLYACPFRKCGHLHGDWHECDEEAASHTARLVCIEEIAK